MIYCSINDLFLYSEISPLFKQCVDYIREKDLTKLPMGRTLIHDNLIYVNKMYGDTESYKNATYESHKKYIDIHVDLEGSEYIGFSKKNLNVYKQYNSEEDYVLYDMDIPDIFYDLSDSFCLICMPEEKHMSGIYNKSKSVLKCCFKVAYQYEENLCSNRS